VGLPENRKTTQNAHSYETTYYGMFHTLMYEWKPISDRKIQHKYRYKIQTAKMCKSVIRRKTPQDVTDRRKTVTSQDA